MNDDPLLWEPYDRHWIRLRGPWDVTWLASSGADEVAADGTKSRVRLPADWQDMFGGRSGTARFGRRFQCPTNLDADERVLVTLCDVRCQVTARLNETPLVALTETVGDPASAPCADGLSFDVTRLLQPSNLLALDLTVQAEDRERRPCGLWQAVLLEVITPE